MSLRGEGAAKIGVLPVWKGGREDARVRPSPVGRPQAKTCKPSSQQGSQDRLFAVRTLEVERRT